MSPILPQHTYASRASSLLQFHEALRRERTEGRRRANKLRLALVIDGTEVKPSKRAMLSPLSDIYDVEILRLEDLGGMPAKSDSPWTTAFDVILGLGDFGSEVDLFIREHSWPPKWTTIRGHPQFRGLVLEAERVSEERVVGVGFGEYDVVFVSSNVQSEQLLKICRAMECNAHVVDAFGVEFLSPPWGMDGEVSQGRLRGWGDVQHHDNRHQGGGATSDQRFNAYNW